MGHGKKTLDQVADSYVGVDIGGSKIEIILWRDGKVLNWRKIKTPKNKKVFLKGVMEAVAEMGLRGVRGIGVAQAGAIDRKTGRILRSPNLKFLDKLNLKKFLEKKFHKPVKIDNDAKCLLLAEKTFGQARGKKNVIALTLGTGIGGAILLEGKIVHGAHGAAGELGHIVIVHNSPGPSLPVPQAGYLKRGIKKKGAPPLRVRGGWEELLDLEDLITAGRRDFKTIGKYLGVGLANIVNIFDPELIILGGGIANDSKWFLWRALQEMKKYTLLPPHLLPPVVVSKLEHAGALGAVSLFLS